VVVFSPRWAAAGGVAAAVAILFGISACLFPLGDAFKALGRQRILVAINVAFLPVLAGSIIAAAPLGIEAVAWVRVASQALFGAVVLIAAAKVLSVRTLRIGSALLPGALAAAVVGGGVELTRILVPGDGMVALMAGALVAVACFAGAVRLVMPDLARRAGSVLRTRRRPLRVALGGPL
jgi:O-antigen/teichoic acid export membrane protein